MEVMPSAKIYIYDKGFCMLLGFGDIYTMNTCTVLLHIEKSDNT